MISELLRSRRFLPLLLTQFFGALNDNLFKNALLILVTMKMADRADILSNVIAALFVIPFFLFSATAGDIADKYDRSRIARWLKIAELVLMCGVAAVYYFHSVNCLIVLLALMGAQSAFFGPVKYSLLPQQLKKEELVAGNAYVEATTYVAILAGLIIGTLLPIWHVICLLIILALTGVISAWFIPSAEPVRPRADISWNVFKTTWQNMKLIYQHKTVFWSILGATWFWTIGAFVAVQIYPLSGQILGVNNVVITYFLMLFSVGVALGSLCCEKMMKETISTLYTPLCTLAMGICFWALYYMTRAYSTPERLLGINDFIGAPYWLGISMALFFVAFFGGIYIVPLNALMQHEAPREFSAAVMGGNNIVNALGMTAVAVMSIVLLSAGITIPQLFLIVALMNIPVFIYVCRMLPDAMTRSLLQSVLRVFFRVRVLGMNNFVNAGSRVLIVANHTSLLDGLLIAAFMPERITFAVNTEWSKKLIVRLFGAAVDLYPLDPANPMAIRSLINECKKDKKVMIFPEGRITVTGGLMKIYEGAGVVAYRTEAVLLPVRISGAQYSKFSYLSNKQRTRLFPKIIMKVLPGCHLQVDDSLSGKERRHHIAVQLYDIMTDMLYKTTDLNQHLFNALMESAWIYGWNHPIAEDIDRKVLTYRKLIQKIYFLGWAFQQQLRNDKFVSLLLPNGLTDVVTFFALQSVEKVPVMLNFSQGIAQVVACTQMVGANTVITAHKFIEKAHLEKLEQALKEAKVNIVYLEEFAALIGFAGKIKGLWRYWRKSKPHNKSTDAAVVLFTSGSEGMPKAVVLSHQNLQANRYQLSSVIAFNSKDVFFNALPMFHSFGLSVGMILPLLSGIRTFFYPTPLHYRIVPELVYDTCSTIICGTDTFFYGYGRMANPYDFFNLKYAVVGGEKLKDRTRDLWMEKFGVRILEGYGATETAPVLCLNTPMYNKTGTVGRLLPGMKYRLEPVAGVANGGRLWVYGDNVMMGYIRADKPGLLQPPEGGWYDTGDIVSMDTDGFVTIQGRAKRFAKIGGEMVSLTSVEQVVDQLYKGALQGIVAVPDLRKGEQLVLITNHGRASVGELRQYFRDQGFSDLWVPKEILYLEHPPVLATGKFDYVCATQIAREMLLK